MRSINSSPFFAGDSVTPVQTTVRVRNRQGDGKDVEAELVLMDEYSNLYESSCLDEEYISGLLRDVGLSNADCCEASKLNLPHGINSSVARNKTLVAVDSVQRLHAASNPTNAGQFRTLCDRINSTGLYLYSKLEVLSGADAYECRQFPRASGYPGDPATGIAAAALAASLRKRGLCGTNVDIFKGTSMGRRSRIGIRFEEFGPYGANCDEHGQQ